MTSIPTNTPVGRAPLVALRRVSRFYRPDRPSLFDISFDIAAGEFVYVTGSSGAGKSTLLKLLYGAELPDTGAIFFNGTDITRLKRAAISHLRRSMGVVYQDYRLVPTATAGYNIGLPLEVAGVGRVEMALRVAEVLERVGLSDKENELASALSGGEQQRVAVARALVGRPELILADEPTASLDAYNADFALDLLEQTVREGATVVLATHDRMLMAARPHRVVALDQGRLVAVTPSQNEVALPRAC